jgi:transposase
MSAEVIAGQLRKDEKFSQGVRLYAVYQIALGRKAEELQSIYNTSHKAICNWVNRFNAEGVAGLSFQKGKGFYPESGGREEAVSTIKKTSRTNYRQYSII